MKKDGIGRIVGEDLPPIDTVRNPALFFDDYNLLLCYKVAPIGGGGVAIVEFEDVLHFERLPVNTRGLADWHLPANPWGFTEVEGAELTKNWAILKPRLWTISFNDLTLVVLFSSVRLVDLARTDCKPPAALARHLQAP